MAEICPRSMNHRPNDFAAVDCIAADECGCSLKSIYIAGLKEAAEIAQKRADECLGNDDWCSGVIHGYEQAAAAILARISSSSEEK